MLVNISSLTWGGAGMANAQFPAADQATLLATVPGGKLREKKAIYEATDLTVLIAVDAAGVEQIGPTNRAGLPSPPY